MKTAIEMEKSGHRFFTEAAAKVGHEVGKKVFARLAKEEIEHLRTFEKIFDQLSGGSAWKDAVGVVQPVKRVKYFDEARAKFKADDIKLELDYLRQALDLERNAMNFFEGAVGEAETAEAGQIFKKVLEEERGHYDLIQAQIDSLNGSGYWFDLPEFHMDAKY
jgi:rubrerythrin